VLLRQEMVAAETFGAMLALERKEVDKVAGGLGALVTDSEDVLLSLGGGGRSGHSDRVRRGGVTGRIGEENVAGYKNRQSVWWGRTRVGLTRPSTALSEQSKATNKSWPGRIRTRTFQAFRGARGSQPPTITLFSVLSQPS
jgi:hypothetical protein